ncbi:pyridoxal-dependent decarboxylase domain-containing protein 1 isoform X1 [Halyomorpha halys]|uniref:pyridoxal-dependent decarboxylase domain-containing protein 1 isoform X1 n=1 Tax=Halyomorpha halys TaxID=286706 RepID=UPI0006D4D290|nr:pyridoxal-dependent decarboxylase domain-containing protein 1 isoform X1 [Halyomorpha halys]XP_014288456.1 pyridoxal-dependent decarboxylase domain-containing protein 1 isoform X1 [Halyomorpha halys]
MATTGVNSESDVKMSEKDDNKKGPVTEIEFQVSQVINRLEEAVIGKNYSQDNSGASLTSLNAESLSEPQPKSVLQQLEDLLVHDSENEVEYTALPELCEASRLSIISHAIAAYSGSLERNHVAHLSSKISNTVDCLIADLFRCENYKVCYHDDQLGGIVRVVRALLNAKVPHYSEIGYEALKKLPVIYTSIISPVGIVQFICNQLGLPLRCVNAIPCNTLFGSQKMDLAALEREIETDKENNRLPLIVLADAGTPVSGHVDNLTRLQEICKANGVWLHLRGHSLAALAVPLYPNATGHISDSMTLPLGIWLGIPGLPTATVYNHELLVSVSPSLLDTPGRKLISLPLWSTFQCLGKEEVRKRFQRAFDWCQQLWLRIEKYPNIRLLSQPPGGEGGIITVSELATKPVNANILFEVAASTVVFQFIPENHQGRVPPYYDKLNSWLGQILQRDCPLVNITLCEVENNEVVLRYCPLEPQPGVHEPPDFESFVACLEQQIEILTATVKHKSEFQKLVEASQCLRLVEIEGWAGLGGVRYQPSAYQDVQLTDYIKEQLNNLNVSLVERLRATDAAFSLGEGGDGLACVRFGMVTSDTDVGELLSLVETAGQEEEETGKVLDTMAEVVKRGIEAATLELQRESDEQLWQEGILRAVPVVGSIVNWWSPHHKGSGIKGRSLDLTAGIVASTENIYRYHMQAAPNQPLEQMPVGHSRSSSASSNQPPHP